MSSNNSTDTDTSSSKSLGGGDMFGPTNATATDGNNVSRPLLSQPPSTLGPSVGHKNDTASPSPIPTAKVSHSTISGVLIPTSASGSLSYSFARTGKTVILLMTLYTKFDAII